MKSTIMTPFVEPTVEADRFLPEGPRAVEVDGRSALAWVNIQAAPDSTTGNIHLRFWDNGERRTLPQVSRPGFILPTERPGTVLVGQGKQLGTLDLASNVWRPRATIDDANPRTIINDGEIVPGGGAIVFGTKDIQFAEPIATLYMLTLPDWRMTVLADGQTCSNGKLFVKQASDLLLFDIDTPRRNVMRYRLDLAARRLGPGEVAFDLSPFDGFPDGMVDAGDGSALIAFYNPAAVPAGRAIRFDLKTGRAIEEWLTPRSPRVTCPLLDERDGRVHLIVTTCDEGMPAEMRAECPNAGWLFMATTELTPPTSLALGL